MSRELEDDEEEELEDVEVERMPDLDGWEFYKAVDGAAGRDRWTVGIQHSREQNAIEYAFWTDVKKDPEATGVLEAGRESSKRWGSAVRRAVESSESRSLDNDARAEVVLAILRQHDPTLESYESRLLFTLEPPSDDEDEDAEDEDDDDEDADDDD
ncbi:hypothetical protein [Polyangium aurulentum]|uniref:hypothetical protein n=1 Tax=Polyangium aurulentum TaxID=2567896 RepID=UPI0010AEA41C|nr:hypothetical protein [Polyangium aurulentum]UQA62815.1 hypothetical protein E8A73_021130 [Polyangium aurulentum]